MKNTAVLLVGIMLLVLAGCNTPKDDDTHTINRPLPAGYLEFPETTEQYDTPPEFVKGRAPLFPYNAHVEGRVPSKGFSELEFTINEKGRVEGIKEISSTHPQFSAAVAHNLRKWKFKPAMKNGVPVAYRHRHKWTLEIQY